MRSVRKVTVHEKSVRGKCAVYMSNSSQANLSATPTSSVMFFHLLMHFCACTGEVSRPRALSCCPRVSSDNSMHHIGRKVRSLELDMEVAGTFDFTPMRFLQNGITSSWHATTPPVLEFQGFEFPFFLPSAFGTSFLTSLWLLGESLHKARFCLRS